MNAISLDGFGLGFAVRTCAGLNHSLQETSHHGPRQQHPLAKPLLQHSCFPKHAKNKIKAWCIARVLENGGEELRTWGGNALVVPSGPHLLLAVA